MTPRRYPQTREGRFITDLQPHFPNLPWGTHSHGNAHVFGLRPFCCQGFDVNVAPWGSTSCGSSGLFCFPPDSSFSPSERAQEVILNSHANAFAANRSQGRSLFFGFRSFCGHCKQKALIGPYHHNLLEACSGISVAWIQLIAIQETRLCGPRAHRNLGKVLLQAF